jgi:hypothetical protein
MSRALPTRFTVRTNFWRRRCFAHHPSIGWWYIPNLTARIPLDGGFYLLRTNAAGMRDDPNYSHSIAPSKKRIVVLGDSYTAGDGVSNGERYSDVLERLHPHLEVLNFGLSNTGTDQQLLVFETMARAYDADAYVFAVLVENIGRIIQAFRPSWDDREMETFCRPKPYFTIEDGELVLQNQPVPLERRTLDNLGDWNRRFPNLNLPEPIHDLYALYRFEHALPWQLLRHILQRFMSQTIGKPVFIMPLPMSEFFLQNRRPGYLERFFSLEDRPRLRHVIDPLPYFLRLPQEQRAECRFPNDPHYSALGHSLVARAISDALAERAPELLTPPANGVN